MHNLGLLSLHREVATNICGILVAAVAKGRLDVARALIDNLLCSSILPGYTELHAACEKGLTEVVRSLLQSQGYKDNIHCCTVYGITPLHVACAKGHLEVVEHLLKSFNHPNVRSAHSITPLHLACIQNHEHIVKFLLSCEECDINIQTVNGLTPFQIVLVSNNTRLLRLLKDKGTGGCPITDTHHRNMRQQSTPVNENGDHLLHLACQWGDRNIMEYFMKEEQFCVKVTNKHGNTPLHIAARYNRHKIAKFLIKSGHPNCKNNSGNTPLHIACYERSFKVIKSLLLFKSSTKIKNVSGDTPQTIPLNEDGDLLLHLACQWGETDIVEYLVSDQQCDMEVRNWYGDTSLHTAVCYNQKAIVRFLTTSGCKPDVRNKSGDTPLHIACYKYFCETIKSLLMFKTNTNIKNAGGDTPQTIPLNDDGDLLLHLACQWGDTDIVKYLVNDQQCDVKVVNKHSDTPLHTAAFHKQCATVKLLITSGSDPDIRNNSGDTPLHLACQWGDTDIVEYLVNDQQCDMEVVNKHGDTPLHTAACCNQHALVTFLITSGCSPDVRNTSGDTPLHIACYKHHFEVIKSLLLLKTNTKITNARGDTPQTIPLNEDGGLLLHLACQLGDTDIVEYLVSGQQCDVKVVNKYGDTPLHTAARCNQHATIRLLISSGCSPDTKNKSGNTPLHIACYKHSLAFIKNLLQLKANTNIKNDRGDTPQTIPLNEDGDLLLNLAGQWGDTDIVEYLVNDQQCDMEVRNRYGDTILHIACYKQCFEVIKSLLLFKSSTKIKNAKGDTPQIIPLNVNGDLLLHLACRWGNTDTVEYLVNDQQCDMEITNRHGNTPLHTAARYNHNAIVSFLIITSGCDPDTSNNFGNTPLHIACYKQNFEVIKSLLLLKINTKITNVRGDTPQTIPLNDDGDLLLHLACQWGDTDIVEYLVSDQQCDINIQNKHGNTPLHTAATHSHDIIVGTLLNHKQCNANLVNANLETPLHVSVTQTDLKTTSLLIGKCNPIAINSQGDTSLHTAAYVGSADICKLILHDKRCGPNIQNFSKNTPLHIAVIRGKLDITKALAEDARCNLNLQNDDGYTPLHLAISHQEHQNARYLINHPSCDTTMPDGDGNTPLHLACKSSPEMIDIAYHLLSQASVDPHCVNNDGQTPVELTTSYQLIQKINYFNECKNKQAVETYIKVFILGNPETDKSTLIKAICREATKWLKLLPRSLRRVKNVPAHTAGIIPTTFRSKKFGNTVLYDLAGQYEYYSSHAAVIETSVHSSPPAFLIVVNLSESHDKIINKVKYWWSFIDNHAARSTAPPHVILVGSHADVVKSKGENAQKKLTNILTAVSKISSSFYCAGGVALDCRNPVSKGLNHLCSLLDQSCSILRQSADVDLHCHVMYTFLQTDLFNSQVACKVSDIAARIKDEDVLLPHNSTDLVKLISSLSDRGLVLLVEATNTEENWVVLQKQKLLSEFNGTIFAPETFTQHKDFSRSTGVVPFSKLEKAFPQYHPHLIATFLTHLEFCFKIDDMETLRRIEDESSSDRSGPTDLDLSNQYYFFPALVSVDNPHQVWKSDDTMTYQCGWYYYCTDPDQFLTTRFLQVLTLRLAFTFALAIDPHHSPQDVPVLCRRCSVWKHGIGWLNRCGIETVVEVGLQCRWVSVVMRYPKGAETMCGLLRSMVIRKVLNTKSEFSPAVMMSEAFLHPTLVQYPFLVQEPQLKLYTLLEIAHAITERNTCVLDQHGQNALPITELLHFEPYFGVGRDLLIELFSQANQTEIVPESFLDQMASLAYPQIDQYIEAIDPQPATLFQEHIQTEPTPSGQCLILLRALLKRIIPTYENFHKEFDRFSIFCGRNPMEIADVKVAASIQNTELGSSRGIIDGKASESTDHIPVETPILKDLMNLPIPSWYSLGLQLGIQPLQLKTIQANSAQFPDFDVRCTADMFQWWLDNDDSPTYRSLVKGLMAAGMTDAVRIVHKRFVPSPLLSTSQENK